MQNNDLNTRTKLVDRAVYIGGPRALQNEGCTLREFLDDIIVDGDDDCEIAWKIIDYFCYHEGEYTEYPPALMLCTLFMAGIGEMLTEDIEMAVDDLREAAENGKTEVVAWAGKFIDE